MKKKEIIFISIIIVLIAIIIGLLFYVNTINKTKDEKVIEAKVLASSEDYLLVTTDDDIDYMINTNGTEYEQGDTLKLELINIDEDKMPREAEAKSIALIKKNTEQTSDNETNDENNNSKEEIGTSYTEENNILENNTSTNTNDSQTNSSENDIISYFNTLDTELTNYNEDSSLSTTLKTKFIKCIDFIFYDGEINGKTFNELSNSAKLKVISIALSIDSKIDSKFPGYKETISASYQNAKTKLIEKYLDITTTICQNDTELCINAKEGFSDLKSSFGVTWQMIKDLAGSGVSKLKSWYEIWKYE
jgi:hypothetical protein